MTQVENELEGQWELSCVPSILGVNVFINWNDVKMLGDTEAQTLFTQFCMNEFNSFPYHRVKPSKTQFWRTNEELRNMFDIPYVFCR